MTSINTDSFSIQAVENGFIVDAGGYYSNGGKYIFADWDSVQLWLKDNIPAKQVETPAPTPEAVML